MSQIDMEHLETVTGRDVEAAVAGGATRLRLHEDAVLTATAREAIRRAGVAVTRGRHARLVRDPSVGSRPGAGAPGAHLAAAGPARAFLSREALAIKEEIIRAGRKLWERQYVDGNGGNISCRLTDNWVICTPTLMSKADMTVDDMCMVDIDGNQIAGSRKRSSEILLHLEIFKAVPRARAVLHCHPPHATAYAVAGVVPPTCMISEHEVFVGPVALAPYQTPGTIECARAVVPYVKDHNTVLLANHGLVCWADSITHAEWYAEVMDTTCRILILAAQLGPGPAQIPAGKIGELLALKERLGMPDARFGRGACARCDVPDTPRGITTSPERAGQGSCSLGVEETDREALVQAVTSRVVEALGRRA